MAVAAAGAHVATAGLPAADVANAAAAVADARCDLLTSLGASVGSLDARSGFPA